jgi:hypothetical protein
VAVDPHTSACPRIGQRQRPWWYRGGKPPQYGAGHQCSTAGAGLDPSQLVVTGLRPLSERPLELLFFLNAAATAGAHLMQLEQHVVPAHVAPGSPCVHGARFCRAAPGTPALLIAPVGREVIERAPRVHLLVLRPAAPPAYSRPDASRVRVRPLAGMPDHPAVRPLESVHHLNVGEVQASRERQRRPCQGWPPRKGGCSASVHIGQHLVADRLSSLKHAQLPRTLQDHQRDILIASDAGQPQFALELVLDDVGLAQVGLH